MMSNRVKAGYMFFLFIFYFSINTPSIDINAVLTRKPNLNLDEIYVCYRETFPKEARILYLSRPDGTMVAEIIGNIMYTQYQLVPRIVEMRSEGPVDFDEFTWFLLHGLSPEDVETFRARHNLQIVNTCGYSTILQKMQDS